MQELEEILSRDTTYPWIVGIFIGIFIFGIIVFVKAVNQNEKDLKDLDNKK